MQTQPTEDASLLRLTAYKQGKKVFDRFLRFPDETFTKSMYQRMLEEYLAAIDKLIV